MADSNAVLRDRLLSRPIVPLPIATVAADKLLASRPLLFVGWSLRETTGSAPATAEFQSGSAAGGSVVGEQQLASGTTGSEAIADEGVLCEGGLFFHVVTGSLTGCAWVRV